MPVNRRFSLARPNEEEIKGNHSTFCQCRMLTFFGVNVSNNSYYWVPAAKNFEALIALCTIILSSNSCIR